MIHPVGELMAAWRREEPRPPEPGEVWRFDGTTLQVIGCEPLEGDPVGGRFRVRVQNGRFQGWRTESAWRAWTEVAERVAAPPVMAASHREEC